MKEKIFKKGFKRRAWAMLIALTLVLSSFPCSSILASAAEKPYYCAGLTICTDLGSPDEWYINGQHDLYFGDVLVRITGEGREGEYQVVRINGDGTGGGTILWYGEKKGSFIRTDGKFLAVCVSGSTETIGHADGLKGGICHYCGFGEHIHTWSYSADGASLTAKSTCHANSSCEYNASGEKTATLTISATQQNYSGNTLTYGDATDSPAKDIGITGYDAWTTTVGKAPKLQFSSDGGATWSDTAPSAVGSYKMSVYPDGETPNETNTVVQDLTISINTWKGLQTAIYKAAQNSTIKLTTDIVATGTDSFLSIENKVITIDLNGHKIDRNLSSPTDEGYVIYVDSGASLTIKDTSSEHNGQITGGNNNNHVKEGFGGGIECEGTVKLESGHITGNKSYGSGAGIDLESGTFIMTGGTISNNEVYGYDGGGLNLQRSSTASLLGGTISGNKSCKDGGIFISEKDASLTLGGTIQIYGNTAGGVEQNIFKDQVKYVKISQETPLTTGAKIGVYRDSNAQDIKVEGLTTENVKYFQSDIRGYEYTCVNTDMLHIQEIQHSWTYSANGATLTATCDKRCGETTAHTKTLTLTASSANYSGTTYTGASIKDSSNNLISDTTNNLWIKAGLTAPTVEYKIGETWGTTAPTAVGSYQVRMYPSGKSQLDSNTAVATFTINKADPVVEDFTYTAPANLVYDGNAKAAAVAAKTGKTNGTITVKYYDSLNAEVTSPTNAGEYKVKITATEGNNYNAITTPIEVGTFTIAKAEYNGTKTVSGNLSAFIGKTVTVTLPALPTGASYGTAINGHTSFFTVGAVSNGTITVTSVKDWDAKTETASKDFVIPVTEATNYDTYGVTVTITPVFHTHTWTYTVGTGNNANTITANCAVANHTGANNIDLILAAESREYTGTAYAGASTNDSTVSFADTTGSTIGAIEYFLENGSTSTTNANSGAASVGAAPVKAGSYVAKVTVTGSNGQTYNIQKAFQITKAAASVTTSPAANTLTYNGTQQALVSAGVSDGGTMLYCTTRDGGYDTKIPTGKNATSYTVWYKVEGDTNHTDTTPVMIDVTIAKKPVTVTGIAANDKEYDKNASADLDYTGVVFGSIESGDSLTVSATGTFADANAGVGKVVTISGITLGGASANNYALAASGNQVSTTATITKANQAAPAATTFTVTNESIKNKKDGKIAGLTTAMEYHLKDAVGGFTQVTDTNMTFAAGTYEVRMKGDENHNASPATEVTIVSGALIPISLPSPQVGYTLTADKTGVEWRDSVVYSFTLAEGYTKTETFAIKVNGTAVNFIGGQYTASYIEGTPSIVVEGVADITAPTAEITVSTNKWNTFLNDITFGIFFKETQSVTVTATDTGSGINTIEYYLTSSALTAAQVEAVTSWTSYTQAFTIDPNNQYVIYAKATDYAGNATYISSNGLVLDSIAPVVTGLVNNNTYCEKVEFTVTESNLDTVKVDGNAMTAVAGKYTITGDDLSHNVVVTDKAGNSVSYTVRVERGHDWIYTVDGATVAASCSRKTACGQADKILTLFADDAAYTGNAYVGANTKDSTVGFAATTGAAIGAIEYYLSDGTTKTTNANSGAATDGAAPVKAGSYVAKVTVTDAYSNPHVATQAFQITKIASSIATIPTAKSLTYNGSEQELVNAGSGVTGGTIKYSTTENGSYSTAIPKETNATSYAVWYKVFGDDNHNDTIPAKVDVTIAKKDVIVSGITASEKTYDGTTGATLSYANVAFAGMVSGDRLTVTATGTFADANAGVDKVVTISGITLGGASANNYALAASGNQVSTTATIQKANQTAPNVSVGNDETIKNKADGKLTGLTTAMEYRLKSETEFTSVTGSDMTFAAGTYEVRVKQDANHNASPLTEVTIAEGRMLTIKAPSNQIGYTLTTDKNEVSYNGTVTLTFTILDGYGKTEMSGIKANGIALSFTNDGTCILGGVTQDIDITVADGYVVDIAEPSAEISVDINKWNTFLSNVTFGIFFKDTQKVTITATDLESGVAKIEYYLSSKELSEAEAKAVVNWTVYSEEFNINPNNKYVIYARVTDYAGNVTYISSNGLVLERPVESTPNYKPDATITASVEVANNNQMLNITPSIKDNDFSVVLDGANLKDAIEVTPFEKIAGVWVWTEVKDASATAPAADVKVIADNVKAATIGAYINVELFKQVPGQKKTQITETDVPVKLTITVPTTIAKANREYAIVRVHGGAYEQITNFTKMDAGNMIEFTSDKFSTYAIIYRDATAPVKSPKTGDTNAWLYMILLLGAGLVFVGASRRKLIK